MRICRFSFVFLNFDNFNCSFVLRWNNLIGQNSLIMKPLRLVYKDYSQPKTDGNKKTDWLSIRQNTEDFTRKYYSLRISDARDINQETVGVMSKHIELRQLEFNLSKISSENSEILTRILQNLNKLEVLSTDMIDRSFEGVRMIKEVQMPNLKTVVIHHSNPVVSFRGFFELWFSGVNCLVFLLVPGIPNNM